MVELAPIAMYLQSILNGIPECRLKKLIFLKRIDIYCRRPILSRHRLCYHPISEIQSRDNLKKSQENNKIMIFQKIPGGVEPKFLASEARIFPNVGGSLVSEDRRQPLRTFWSP